MTRAAEMRQKAEESQYNNIINLVEYLAGKGLTELYIYDYDSISVTEDVKIKLETEGFEVTSNMIKW